MYPSIEIEEHVLEQLHGILADAHTINKKIIGPAFQRGMSAGRAFAAKQLPKRYYTKANIVREESTLKRSLHYNGDGEITGWMLYGGHAIPLYKFFVNPNAPTYGKERISAVVRRGNGMTELEHAFITITHRGHWGVFERISGQYMPGKPSKPHYEKIEEKYGPSVPTMLNNEEMEDALQKRMNEIIGKRLDHEIDRFLNQ